MYSIRVLRRIREDPKYLGLFVLIVGFLVFYPVVKYVFNPYFLWILTLNSYDGKWYSIFINQYVLFQREFAVKVIIFTTVLGVAVFVSIKY